MKTKTLLCTLMVLVIAFANAQSPVDLKQAPNNAGQLPPHLRERDAFMLRMYNRIRENSLNNNANTQSSKVNGFIQWQKCLGGTRSEYAYSIQQTKDGGYIVAGSTDSNDGDVSGHHGSYYSDYWIVKLNSSSAIEWQKSLGGSDDDIATSIQQTMDGGYIVAGNSSSNDGDVSGHHGKTGEYWTDCWIVKLSSTGTIEWQKSLGGSSYDEVYSIQQTKDGGYIVAGDTDSDDGDVHGYHGFYDCWIVKLSSTGTIEWQKSLGGTEVDAASMIQQTKDDGYIVAARSKSNNWDVSGHHGKYYSFDFWIIKLSSTGAIEWQKSLGGTGDDGAYSIQQTKDGEYVAAGYSYSNDGDVSGHHYGLYINSDYWIVKLSSSGAIEWQKSLGGTGNEGAISIQQSVDGGYIVVGDSDSDDGDVSGHHGNYYSDYWIVKLGRNGNLQLEESFGGSSGEYRGAGCVTKDYGYVVAGSSYSNDGDVSGNHGYSDYWIVKLKGLKSLLPTAAAPTTSSDKRIAEVKDAAKSLLHIQPNPSPNGTFTIDIGAMRNNVLISVTNNSGRQVYAKQLTTARQISIHLNNQPKGMYYLQISYDGGKQTTKLMVQ